MCGIVALFSRREPVSETVLQRATQSLYHRGPDGQRHWIAPDRRVGLGHARLSIIDLTTGDQPIASEDEQARIVVNGEFYGYEAIQRELEQSGHRLRTRSDSEIALHLYEDLGAQCLHRLRGEFAFVLWDETNRTIFAARDRFGIKPLFYAFHRETLYFASEVKALFAAGVPARWDAESVYHSVEFGGHQVRTLFDGILQVPPGHYLIATDNHVQLHQYWDFNYPRADNAAPQRSDADYAAEFRDALEEAVRIRLRADVPVGCYLSGGLDSCAVLGLAARHHPEPIRAFTLTFDRAEYDEEKEAREMAAKAGAEFFPIPIRQDDLADHFADAISQSETLCFNAHGVAKYLLSRAVRDAGYKVVITGEGSDEILGGYAHFRRDMLLYNREGQDPAVIAGLLEDLERLNPVSRGLLLPDGDAGPLHGVKRLLGFVPSWIETFSARAVKMQALLAGDFLEKFGQREGFTRFLQRCRRSRPAHRSRSAEPVALPVGKNGAAHLHPDHAGGPHGDGALHRGTRAFPGSSCRGSAPLPAGDPKDPRNDGEVRASRGGSGRHHRHGLPQAEAPILEPAGDLESRATPQFFRAGHAPRPRTCFNPFFRSEKGHRSSGQAGDDG